MWVGRGEEAQGEPQVSLVIEEWNEKMWTGKVKIVIEGEGWAKCEMGFPCPSLVCVCLRDSPSGMSRGCGCLEMAGWQVIAVAALRGLQRCVCVCMCVNPEGCNTKAISVAILVV